MFTGLFRLSITFHSHVRGIIPTFYQISLPRSQDYSDWLSITFFAPMFTGWFRLSITFSLPCFPSFLINGWGNKTTTTKLEMEKWKLLFPFFWMHEEVLEWESFDFTLLTWLTRKKPWHVKVQLSNSLSLSLSLSLFILPYLLCRARMRSKICGLCQFD